LRGIPVGDIASSKSWKRTPKPKERRSEEWGTFSTSKSKLTVSKKVGISKLWVKPLWEYHFVW